MITNAKYNMECMLEKETAILWVALEQCLVNCRTVRIVTDMTFATDW